MTGLITGLHHVTATVADAQSDVDFYTRLLGLRLVKQTINFDNTAVYHFYYGDARGTPGTIMTTFPYAGQGVRNGQRGTGQVATTAFSIPPAALDFWRSRLSEHGVEVEERGLRFGDSVIGFRDPAGLDLELIAAHDPRTPWLTDIDVQHAVRGIHSVTLALADAEPTADLLRDIFGFAIVGDEGGRLRLGAGEGDPGQVLDLVALPGEAKGLSGIGTVHHVAFSVASVEVLEQMRERLLEDGHRATEVKDRKYFRSIYFRTPGGVLFEIATAVPGFTVDEDKRSLGTALMLPEWAEPRREEIEASLPIIQL